MYGAFARPRVCVCASDMPTFFGACAPHSVMCKMCELEPCLACQSDEEIIIGVTLTSLISLISCHTNTNLYMCLCPAAKYQLMSRRWIHNGIQSLNIFLVNSPCSGSSHITPSSPLVCLTSHDALLGRR